MSTHKKPMPTVLSLGELVAENDEFRNVVWTGHFLQMTSMTIKRGKSIGWEVHPETDQTLLIQQGRGLVSFRSSKHGASHETEAEEGSMVLVPAGTWHNVSNIGRSKLKLVSLYAPPHHHE